MCWLTRKDSNLRSPDPESDDANRVCQPIFELSSAPRAVCIRECQANIPRRVMRTSGFAHESSEVAAHPDFTPEPRFNHDAEGRGGIDPEDIRSSPVSSTVRSGAVIAKPIVRAGRCESAKARCEPADADIGPVVECGHVRFDSNQTTSEPSREGRARARGRPGHRRARRRPVLMLAPRGEIMPLPLSALAGSPFDTYFVPGLILFGVLGLGPLIAARLT